jgi:hypothetical protein
MYGKKKMAKGMKNMAKKSMNPKMMKKMKKKGK